MRKSAQVLLTLLVLSSTSTFADIPVLSIDKLGHEEATSISDEEYQKVLSLQADTSAQAAEDQFMLTPNLTTLQLKGLMVGLEALGTIGIGDFKMGAGVSQQFYFEIRK